MQNLEATFQGLELLKGANFIAAIEELESNMIQNLSNEEKIDPPVKHSFAKNLYIREMSLLSGQLLIGKTHRHDHFFNLLTGRVLILSEHGGFVAEAPTSFVSEKGAKRLFIAFSDSILQTVHATDLKDLAELENELIVPPEEVHQFRIDNDLEVY